MKAEFRIRQESMSRIKQLNRWFNNVSNAHEELKEVYDDIYGPEHFWDEVDELKERLFTLMCAMQHEAVRLSKDKELVKTK